MKNLILVFGILTAFLFLFGAIAMIETDSEKETSLTESVRVAIHQTMEECKNPTLQNQVWKRYDTPELVVREGLERKDELMIQCFKDNLHRILNTEDAIKIRVIAANWQEGILSVEVKRNYRNLGVKRSAYAKETVIYNQKTDDTK